MVQQPQEGRKTKLKRCLKLPFKASPGRWTTPARSARFAQAPGRVRPSCQGFGVFLGSPCSWGGFAAPRAWRQPWGGAGGPACPAVPPSGTPALLGQGAPAQPAANHPGKASFYISPLILLQLVSHSPFWSPSQEKGRQHPPGPGCSKSSPPIPRYVYAPRRARKRREKAPTLLSGYFQTQPAEQHSCLGVPCVHGSFPQGLGHPGDCSCTHPRQGTGKAGRGGWPDTSNGARSCPFGACGPGGKL